MGRPDFFGPGLALSSRFIPHIGPSSHSLIEKERGSPSALALSPSGRYSAVALWSLEGGDQFVVVNDYGG